MPIKLVPSIVPALPVNPQPEDGKTTEFVPDKVKVLPLIESDCVEAGPAGPVAPVDPVAPFDPLVPVAPVSPVGPVKPCIP